jgi:hypothetical protein
METRDFYPCLSVCIRGRHVPSHSRRRPAIGSNLAACVPSIVVKDRVKPASPVCKGGVSFPDPRKPD